MTDFALQIRDAANTANVGAVISFTAGSSSSIIKATWTSPNNADAGYNVQIIPSVAASTTYLHVFSLSAFIKVGNILTPIFQNYIDLSRSNTMVKYFYVG